MHDGWVKVLTKAGYQVLHEHSTRGVFSERAAVRTKILRDGVEVLSLEQTEVAKGGASLAEVYRAAAIRLGVVDPRPPYCPEGPTDLSSEVIDKDGAHEATAFRHPSFGTVSLHRYTGGGKQFMSPINTHGGMKIVVHSARLLHDFSLGTDSVYAEDTLFEFEMSFTQFAEFVTSQGIGSGVPCTLRYVDGMSIQPCEVPTALERLEDNARESMNRAVADVQRIMSEIESEMSGPGALSATRKKEIWEKFQRAASRVYQKPSWLMQMWTETVQETLTHAKSEFSHWARDLASRAGIDASELPGDASRALGRRRDQEGR